ncbi:hypothetical protein CYMTET_5840 [Cymbomonas tetramitiformis]|uniref:Alpha/beta hydrolase fold-3 domain-containing protein n=1 Tax=Cymbomonas tetramitiformis TaxID=36881 RepID=A0AAE0GYB8_9CHLO|nr:hypothetical protein CYMTET_5840 [Cymbomonas tetramitiformis]|tara:strand:+ start:781 stop:1566 length:786 start_codon:yes stop_codon:yes gene_type:complete
MRLRLAQRSRLSETSEWVSVGDASIECRGDAASDQAIVYCVGGGFFLGPTDMHRQLVDELCAATNSRGLIIHHRLAPENPFPIPVEDTIACLRHINDVFSIRKYAMIADSSGAAVGLSAVVKFGELGGRLPSGLVLLSPYTDLANTGRSYVSNAQCDPNFGPQALIHKAWYYLQGHNPTDPLASPFWGDLSGLPPSIIFVGSKEVMHEDAVRLSEKLNLCGSPTALNTYDHAPHVWPLNARLPEATEARAEMVTYLEKAFE